MAFSKIRPYQHVAIRLPSDTVKVEHIPPNTTINLGKYGTFHTNSIIGRPYHLTFEILDRAEQKDGRELRIVRAAEIHAETILDEAEPDLADNDSTLTPAATHFDEYGLPTTTDKSNINIVDDPNNQKLTYADIEALKSDQLANPKEMIAKIMANHSQLDQKTAFSLAKYTLRKQKKYMKRFTVLPLDVGTLTDWMMNEKDFAKIMEMRNETLGLIGSWANVHASGSVSVNEDPRCRYLVVDDTGGLVVSALAERMGILHHQQQSTHTTESEQSQPEPTSSDAQHLDEPESTEGQRPKRRTRQHHDHPLATSNTLTLIHPNQQPNLSLLRYFSFDPNQPPHPTLDPSAFHSLHTHLTTLTWLQLLHPESDTTYASEPPVRTPEELAVMKPNHRATYYRKRRRWTRTKEIVDCTREGGFDGLIVASHTNPVSICRHLVPLLRGGAQIVVYSPHIEPIMELCDVYSTARRTAYLQQQRELAQAHENQQDQTADTKHTAASAQQQQGNADAAKEDEAKFPVDPTLLLNFTVHHSVARPWQVLPGRTHPLMMGKGGAEGGYVAVATRVIPYAGGVVQARGRQGRGRKRRADEVGGGEEDGRVETGRAREKGAEEKVLVDVEMEMTEDGVEEMER